MVTLSRDIIGRFPPKTRYGLAGDKVEIISLHGHVFIVQGSCGLRFCAIADDLSGVPKEMLAQAMEAESQMKVNPSVSSPAAPHKNAPEGSPAIPSSKKQYKAAAPDSRCPVNQKSLFWR